MLQSFCMIRPVKKGDLIMRKKVWIFFLTLSMLTGLILTFTIRKECAVGRKTSVQSERAEQKRINVPLLCQFPDLPTGCESTAAAMVLQYYGDPVTPEQFASRWLECSSDFYFSGDKMYGPDPEEVFAGDPFSSFSYGCYADVIVQAVNQNSTVCEAAKITGTTVDELCKKYIDKGFPVLIWATIEMQPAKTVDSWYLKDGTLFTWLSGEHCLVLVGYDPEAYYFNDPQQGTTQSYPKAIVEKRYEELNNQAVCIFRRES